MTRVKYNVIDAAGVLSFEKADKIQPTKDGIEITQIHGNRMTAEKFLVTVDQFIGKVADGISVTNTGAGVPLVINSSSVSTLVKSLVAGPNITITPGADTITIEASNDGVVTGASYNTVSKLLTLTRSNSLPDVTVTLGGDGVIDGASIVGSTLVFTRTEGLGNINVDLSPLFTSYVPNTRTITGTGGLTGGGDLSVNRTISVATGGITNTMLAASGFDISKFTTGTLLEALLPHPYVRTDADSTIDNSIKLRFGTGADFTDIYHDGTNTTFIDVDGTLNIRNWNGSSFVNSIRSTSSGAAELLFSGSTKLATTATGVTVTGPVTASQATLGTHLVRKDQVNLVTGGIAYETKQLEIGDWNMDTTGTKTVPHGLSASSIRGVTVMLRSDTGTGAQYQVPGYDGQDIATMALQADYSLGASSVEIRRKTGGSYDNTSFDSTGFNRGWVIITYVI